MSEITGTKRENLGNGGAYTKNVGFFKGKLVAINPTREKLNQLLGTEEDKEIEYTGEKDGISTAKIVLWFKVEGKDLYLQNSISLRNEIRLNKAKDKVQYINQVGDTTWVKVDEDGNKDESTLWKSFKHWTKVTKWLLLDGTESDNYEKGSKPSVEEVLGDKIYRPALVGEEQLATFVKIWLHQMEYRKPGANILFDTKKFFGNNFKSLSGEIGGDFAGDGILTGLAYVSVDENDSEKKYQRVWKEFLPGSFMKFINNGKFTAWAEKTFNKFKENAGGEYGIDGFVTYEPLREYKESEDLCAAKGGNVPEMSNVDDKY